MINLHERLSEFSFGYGVTREAESLLAASGLVTTPFLPSLLHEKKLGFDVAFSGAGTVVMLQFKLGQELKRFRKTFTTQVIPKLRRPFWRFSVDTSEDQFRRLHRSQHAGAEVYYVAPCFSDWSAYESAFLKGKVLSRSLLITPSEIRRGTGGSAGAHRIVYDKVSRYVCSEPISIEEIKPEAFAERVSEKARDTQFTLEARLERLYAISEDQLPQIPPIRRKEIEERAKSKSDGLAALVGLEAWIQGAQALFVTPASP